MDSIPGLALWSMHQSKQLPLVKLKTMAKDGPESKPIESEEDRAIVFVEPRKHPSTEYVLRNFAYFLPTWKIIIVHGEDNKDFMHTIAEKIQAKFDFFSCKLSNLPTPSYNTLFTHPAFWKLLPKWVLIAQTDTMLLQPAKPFLDALITQDIEYCGAPWNYLCHRCKKPLDEKCGHMIDQAKVAALGAKMVGNGGLSFRNARRMEEICSTKIYSGTLCKDIIAKWGTVASREKVEGTTNEDVFYCTLLDSSKLPQRSEALKFAIEQVAPESWDGSVPSMGVHKPWVYLPLPLVESILNKVIY